MADIPTPVPLVNLGNLTPEPQPLVSQHHSDSESSLKSKISDAFEVVVHWRKNLFDMPKGAIGKSVVKEMSNLIDRWTNNSSERGFCLKSLMVLPNLLLQRSLNSKNAKHQNKNNRENLIRRFQLWKDGKIDDLMLEGRAIQNRLSSGCKSSRAENKPRLFRNMMSEGNLKGALRLLSEQKAGVLKMDDATLSLLKEKHPEGEPAHEEFMLKGPIPVVQNIIFDEIDADLVRSMALKTKGAAGPSNLDADQWRRILCSKDFSVEGLDLCRSIANMTKSLCTTKVSDLESLEALVACSLIPLDKDPGVRPIGIGEVLRRIMGKVVTKILQKDLVNSVDGVQMCVGQQGGAEAAVHAMVDLFDDESSHGLIQVDATNAFNSLNRKVLLNNVFQNCPEIAIYTYNCYARPARLFVTGGGEISSQEGTTQGDPIAMPIYAIGLDPLIGLLKLCNGVKQADFADDLAGVGSLEKLKVWWDTIVEKGPKIGYFAEAEKSWLIVKPEYLEHATEMFAGSGLKITTNGRRHLGAVIGSDDFKTSYVEEKVSVWVKELVQLTDIAKSEPHAAYSAYVFAFKSKFNYLFRTVSGISELLKPLDVAVDDFLKVLFQGRDFSLLERKMFSLPAKLGGLGIDVPSSMSQTQYDNSRLVTQQLVEQLKSQSSTSQVDSQVLQAARRKIVSDKAGRNKLLVESIKTELPADRLKVFEFSCEEGASSWLTALPISRHGFMLSKQEFCDALYIRYGFQMRRLPASCVCGAHFSVEHAMTCRVGGYVIRRHNDIRDTLASILKEVAYDVHVEPALTPLTGEVLQKRSTTRENEARCDVAARDVWTRGVNTFLDVRVFNPLAPSYRSLAPAQIYKKLENEKKGKYAERVVQVEKGTFTPIVFSSLGGCGVEASRLIKRMAEMLADKQSVDKAGATNLIKTKLAFSVLKSAVLCIRGTRSSKCRRAEVEIDAAMEINAASL
jgi:hypothetical protein